MVKCSFKHFKKKYIEDRGNLEFISFTDNVKKEWINKIKYSQEIVKQLQKK